jgi:hypothetical protein
MRAGMFRQVYSGGAACLRSARSKQGRASYSSGSQRGPDKSGLGFELPDSVAVGTRVSVHFGCGIAFGQIKHCTPKNAVYRAGMRIEEFIVRHGATGVKKEALAVDETYRKATHSRHTKRRFSFVRQTFCSIAGHEYGWSIGLWERATLGCKRCEKVLSP